MTNANAFYLNLQIGSAFSCDASNHTDNQYKSPIKTKNCVLEISESEEIK